MTHPESASRCCCSNFNTLHHNNFSSSSPSFFPGEVPASMFNVQGATNNSISNDNDASSATTSYIQNNLACCLHLMNEAIDSIPIHEKTGYLNALRRCPDVVEEESDPLLFLQYENFNIYAAAVRLTKYWEWRDLLFDDFAYLPILDLNAQIQNEDFCNLIQDKAMVLLPTTDKDNNSIIYYDKTRFHLPWEDLDTYRMLRVVFHIFTLTINVRHMQYKAQRRIDENVVESHPHSKLGSVVFIVMMSKLARGGKTSMNVSDCINEALPIRVKNTHLVFVPSPFSTWSVFLESVVPYTVNMVVKYFMKSTKIFSHVCCNTNDIQQFVTALDVMDVNGLPGTLGGEWNSFTTDCHCILKLLEASQRRNRNQISISGMSNPDVGSMKSIDIPTQQVPNLLSHELLNNNATNTTKVSQNYPLDDFATTNNTHEDSFQSNAFPVNINKPPCFNSPSMYDEVSKNCFHSGTAQIRQNNLEYNSDKVAHVVHDGIFFHMSNVSNTFFTSTLDLEGDDITTMNTQFLVPLRTTSSTSIIRNVSQDNTVDTNPSILLLDPSKAIHCTFESKRRCLFNVLQKLLLSKHGDLTFISGHDLRIFMFIDSFTSLSEEFKTSFIDDQYRLSYADIFAAFPCSQGHEVHVIYDTVNFSKMSQEHVSSKMIQLFQHTIGDKLKFHTVKNRDEFFFVFQEYGIEHETLSLILGDRLNTIRSGPSGYATSALRPFLPREESLISCPSKYGSGEQPYLTDLIQRQTSDNLSMASGIHGTNVPIALPLTRQISGEQPTSIKKLSSVAQQLAVVDYWRQKMITIEKEKEGRT